MALNRVAGTAYKESLAHEVTHAFGIGHDKCGDNPDESLPCLIEEVGVDLEDNGSVFRGSADLMMQPAGPIPSIVVWERLFNLLS